MSALDIQYGGDHYRKMAIQRIEFTTSNMMGDCEGSTIKYASRWREKGGLEDVKKCHHLIQILLEDRDYGYRLNLLRKAVPLTSIAPEAVPAEVYISANGIQEAEAVIITCIHGWNMYGQRKYLLSALQWADRLIELAKTQASSDVG